MGFFSLRKRSDPSTIPTPGSALSLDNHSSSSAFPLPSALEIITLRVAVDPAPTNQGAKSIFYVTVGLEESVAALRREIARSVGHSSMSLFKVAIPTQAHRQAQAYTAEYGKAVDLLANFPAFNLDDPQQLELSLPPQHRGLTPTFAGSPRDLKIRHWFPNHIAGDVINVVARPRRGVPVNTKPLTLRVFLASPPSNGRPATMPETRQPPLVVDVDPYITVNELKMELLTASGNDSQLWKNVTLWQIAMTESEMTVIDELGRLMNGKMPWPYPPGALEPIALSDNSLPISLFFPKSAPNGDMLNLSMWFSGPTSTPSLGAIPPFRYPMPLSLPGTPSRSISPGGYHSPHSSGLSPLPVQMDRTQSASPTLGTPVAELFSIPPKSKDQTATRGSRRPRTAPTVLASDFGASFSKDSVLHSGGVSELCPPSLSTSPSLSPRSIPSGIKTSLKLSAKGARKGLGIVIPSAYPLSKQLSGSDRDSFSSSEDEMGITSLPSLNFSQHSLETPREFAVKTPVEIFSMKMGMVDVLPGLASPQRKQGPVSSAGRSA
ncbi:hypothetical protein B9479_006150 [Cryptococcus floricola]|uniref:Uncharacterized protein n=1 Tax=Cryptococcus floricola TaxID=2591691 RepID=A0A5D3ANX6_9TREE|nr:hypothetical protein B9479_006150 [Cryptococcus floricola]